MWYYFPKQLICIYGLNYELVKKTYSNKSTNRGYGNIAQWDDITDPKNGHNVDDAIKLEVAIKLKWHLSYSVHSWLSVARRFLFPVSL